MKRKQSQPLRIEKWGFKSFTTSRCIGSRLWFVGNSELEERILGYLGKYKNHHKVKLYSMVMQGNHYHTVADFNDSTKAAFFRDLNARISESVRACVKEFEEGPLFERRYSEQALPLNEDIEDRFFYCALQPVYAGLCEHAEDYPGYNSFLDAISGVEREVKVVDGTKYRQKRRYNKNISVEEFTTTYVLRYERLPGYENLSQEEYKEQMLEKYEQKRQEAVAGLKAKGHRFPPVKRLKDVIPGTKPKRTKKSTRESKRPLVLTRCAHARQKFLDWYFSVYDKHKAAGAEYRKGKLTAKFPRGTYRPPLFSLAR